MCYCGKQGRVPKDHFVGTCFYLKLNKRSIGLSNYRIYAKVVYKRNIKINALF
jgi:hypothetical protein